MKKNPVFLVMLMIMLAFSMTFVGCEEEDDGGDDDGKKTTQQTGGGNLAWPAGFTYADGNTVAGKVDRIGTWTAAGIGNLTFHESSGAPFASFGMFLMPDLVKVEGKKITVRNFGESSDILLCTDYTLDETADPVTLTLTGGDDAFEDYMDVALTKN
jgi:hypothetical protein